MYSMDFIKLVNNTENLNTDINIYLHQSQDGHEKFIFNEYDNGILSADIKVVEDYITFAQIKINPTNNQENLNLEEFGIKILKQLINLNGETEYKELYIKMNIPNGKKTIETKTQKFFFYWLKKINENNSFLFIKFFNQIQIINIYVKDSNTVCQLKYKKLLQEKFNDEEEICRLSEYLNNQLKVYEIYLLIKKNKEKEIKIINIDLNNEKKPTINNFKTDININFKFYSIIGGFNCNKFFIREKSGNNKLYILKNNNPNNPNNENIFTSYELVFEELNKILKEKNRNNFILNLNEILFLFSSLYINNEKQIISIFRLDCDQENQKYNAVLFQTIEFNLGKYKDLNEFKITVISDNQIVFDNKGVLFYFVFNSDNFLLKEIHKFDFENNINGKYLGKFENRIYFIIKTDNKQYFSKIFLNKTENFQTITYTNCDSTANMPNNNNTLLKEDDSKINNGRSQSNITQNSTAYTSNINNTSLKEDDSKINNEKILININQSLAEDEQNTNNISLKDENSKINYEKTQILDENPQTINKNNNNKKKIIANLDNTRRCQNAINRTIQNRIQFHSKEFLKLQKANFLKIEQINEEIEKQNKINKESENRISSLCVAVNKIKNKKKEKAENEFISKNQNNINIDYINKRNQINMNNQLDNCKNINMNRQMNLNINDQMLQMMLIQQNNYSKSGNLILNNNNMNLNNMYHQGWK